MTPGLPDAGRDLLLGSSCVGCGSPGRVLCPACGATLPHRGQATWPTPTPPGLAPPFAAGDYAGLLKALVNRHKEDAVLGLAGPLGRVLGDVVQDLLAAVGTSEGPVVLVPVPSRAAVVRRRGHDPLLRVARRAAARLRSHGVDASVRRLLVPSRRVLDQSTLGAAARSENLAGSLRCRRGGVPASGPPLVVVDDVLTTGATAREAQRALERGGATVVGIATVAATRRRHGAAADRGGAGPEAR